MHRVEGFLQTAAAGLQAHVHLAVLQGVCMKGHAARSALLALRELVHQLPKLMLAHGGIAAKAQLVFDFNVHVAHKHGAALGFRLVAVPRPAHDAHDIGRTVAVPARKQIAHAQGAKGLWLHIGCSHDGTWPQDLHLQKKGTVAIYGITLKMAMRDFKRALRANARQLPRIVNPESRESLQELQLINKLGILTDDSQEGIVEHGRVPLDRALWAKVWARAVRESLDKHSESESSGEEDTARRAAAQSSVSRATQAYKRAGGQYTQGVTMKERAYLTGFMPLTQAQELVNMLNQESNLVAFCTTAKQSVRARAPCTDAAIGIGVTYDLAHQEGGYSRQDAYPLYPVSRLNTLPPVPSIGHHMDTLELPWKRAWDKDFAFVSIMDARYGHHVRRRDGLFKREPLASHVVVIHALQAQQ